MYVAPNTDLYLLSGVPLLPNYENTIYFSSAADQQTYFTSQQFSPQMFQALSYQRETLGVVRVKANAETLHSVNYMMFRNTAFGSKWFYAFVTSVEYVNNATTEVRYMIDVMQTWAFDYSLNMCFVEREHVADDSWGIHTLDEGLDTGAYMFQGSTIEGETGYHDPAFTNYQIVIAATFSGTYDSTANHYTFVDSVGGLYGGVYSGLRYNVCSTAALANLFIADATLANLADGIVSIFMMPFPLLNASSSTEAVTISRQINRPLTIGAYTPRNNKLLTYPYTFLHVINNNGSEANYRWERSGTSAGIQMRLKAAMQVTPECEIVPVQYNGAALDYNDRFVSSDFPQCSYNTDLFKAWVAQKSHGGWLVDLGNGFRDTQARYSAYASAPTPAAQSVAIASTVANVVGNVANLIGTGMIYDSLPPQNRGVTSNVLNVSDGRQGFSYYNAYIREENAIVIDQFFDRFGYKCCLTKTPNRAVRQRWTYTKTQGCTVSGTLPAADADVICKIHDAGITYWRYRGVDDTLVGNYSPLLDNSPLA